MVFQNSIHLAVSEPIRIELGLPEIHPRFRHGRVTAAGVTVPETAVNENNRLVLRQDNIGLADETQSGGFAESEAHTM